MTTAPLTKPTVGTVYDAMAEAIAPCLSFPRRILKHPRLMPYNRLVVLTMAVNLGWAIYAATAANWWTSDGADLGALALTAQVNLAAAVIFRQPYVLALRRLRCRPPESLKTLTGVGGSDCR